jgi:hypothetical protein
VSLYSSSFSWVIYNCKLFGFLVTQSVHFHYSRSYLRSNKSLTWIFRSLYCLRLLPEVEISYHFLTVLIQFVSPTPYLRIPWYSYLKCHQIWLHTWTTSYCEIGFCKLGDSIYCNNWGCGCDNQWTCVDVWSSIIGTGRVQTGERNLGCHIHVDTLVSRRNQPEAWVVKKVYFKKSCLKNEWIKNAFFFFSVYRFSSKSFFTSSFNSRELKELVNFSGQHEQHCTAWTDLCAYKLGIRTPCFVQWSVPDRRFFNFWAGVRGQSDQLKYAGVCTEVCGPA